jgi:hypothetical protein
MKAREIETGDILIALKIVRKLGLEQLKSVVGVESVVDKDPAEIKSLINKKAFEVISYLLGHLEEANQEVVELLSGWTGTTEEEFKRIKLSEWPALIDDFIALNSSEVLVSFFKRAMAGLNKNI